MYPARAINDGWRLDYILSDHRLKVEKAAIHNEFEGSDHCPVSAIIKIKN
jgi:exodeoxyribonuclease-3